MPKKAKIKYRSLRTNLVHLPLSLYSSLTQQQTRPQGILLHVEPLTASSSRAVAAHIGWSGLASASSLAGGMGGEETLEIDPEVAMSLGWNDGALVEIGIIHNPTKARSVSVTPVSEDDWEILEQHASFLEENLLMQMRAATKGRTYDVWVHRTKIRIRVDETDPRTSEKSVVLLHPGTEIYVAPRLRKPQSQSRGEGVFSFSSDGAGINDVTESSRKGKEKEKSIKMRLIPPRIASQWGTPSVPEMELGELENVIYISPDSLARARRNLEIDGEEPVYIRLSQVSREPKGKTSKKITENGAVSADADAAEDSSEATKTEGWLLGWNAMPEGCCVVGGLSKEGWSDWALVRISRGTPPKGRLKGNKSKDTSRLDFETFPWKAPISVVQGEIDEGARYLQRSSHGINANQCRPLLITGGKGSGKTTVARAIATRLEADRNLLCEVIYVDVGRVSVDGRLSDLKATVQGWYDQVRERRPAILVLDGLDTVLSVENELTPSTHPTILAEQFCRLFSPDHLGGVPVIATASSSSSLHPLLNTKHTFGETIKIPALTKEKRRDVIEHFVGTHAEMPPGINGRLQVNGGMVNGDADHDGELDYVTLASTTEGFSINDLKDLTLAASQQSSIRSLKDNSSGSGLIMDDFVTAQAAFTPVSLRGVTLQKSSVAWSDIGGLLEPRRILRETLEWPTKYAQIFASCPLRLRSGLLLYGYPGCGKTLLASAVAKECGLNFISVKGPEILNKYIGASEKAVRDLFERASGAKPCILFFDEFDSIAPKRGHDSTGVTDRVVNQMLTEMDGAQGLDGVYVLAATSRPDLIDSALLRPGRLDKSVLCDMPTEEERLDILRAVSAKLHLGADVDLVEVASKTQGFSGADLQALVYNAHLDVVHASIADQSQKKSLPNGTKGKIHEEDQVKYRQIAPVSTEAISRADQSAMESRIETIVSNPSRNRTTHTSVKVESPISVIEQHHLLTSLANTRPSVSSVDFARLNKIYSTFSSSDRDGAKVNGDMGSETGTRSSLM